MTSVAEVDSAMVNSYHLGSVLDKRTEFRWPQNWSFVARSGMYFFFKKPNTSVFKNCMYILKKWYR